MMDGDCYTLGGLAVLVVLDIITGMTKAWEQRSFSSKKMREGLAHKITYMVVITLAFVLQFEGKRWGIGDGIPLVTPVCAYIALTEITSILENATAINPDLASNEFLKMFQRHDVDIITDNAKDNKEYKEEKDQKTED